MTKLRILAATPVAGLMLPVDAVPDLPEHLAADLVALGAGDDHPDAVAYAETLRVALPEGFAEALAGLEQPSPLDLGKMTVAEIVAFAREHIADDWEPPANAKKADLIAAVELALAEAARAD